MSSTNYKPGENRVRYFWDVVIGNKIRAKVSLSVAAFIKKCYICTALKAEILAL